MKADSSKTRETTVRLTESTSANITYPSNAAAVRLRPADTVMQLDRLGSLHQCRLSFMRQMTRRMAAERWRFSRPEFNIDNTGVGYAVYTAHYPGGEASLIAFAHDLPDELRSDRVIAEQWDTTFTLFNGQPTKEDIERLRKNVPKQEAGRLSEKELTLSRANRSVRLWETVVAALASGQQPDETALQGVGYLMRTTAVYGSGKFGAADREQLLAEPTTARLFTAPFSVEMLTVYLIRTFVRDLINHAARCAGGSRAVTLAPELARGLGIGNSTGLGMAPFLINHPVLIHNWINARETAIARVRAVEVVHEQAVSMVSTLLKNQLRDAQHDHSQHPIQQKKQRALVDDLQRLINFILQPSSKQPFFWNAVMDWANDHLSLEGQECLASLLLEPYPELVDDLSLGMHDSVSHSQRIDGSQSVSEVTELLKTSFSWAQSIDWQSEPATARCWYVSEEKLEPRLGERYEEPLSDYEQPLAPARDAVAAINALQNWADETTIAEVLVAEPQHRRAVQRAQWGRYAPYGEIRSNTIDADMMPIDLLRAKLSFFGATRFDPRSDRWVRICLYPGAPYPEELNTDNADRWIYPIH